MPKARRQQKHVAGSRREQFVEAVQINGTALPKPLK
jgi:hypothetical protein